MDDDSGILGIESQSCSKGLSKKRKQPDEEDILLREGPLTAPPIDNEYEQLDEDDEDDEDHTNNLGRIEFERIKLAQEKATISQYDDIKVTPFNLNDELEEGQFDRAGNFVFKRKEVDEEGDEDANDTWAESIDWAEVEKKERDRLAAVTTETSESSGCQTPRQTNTQTTESSGSQTSKRPNIEPTVIRNADKFSCYKEMLRLMRPDESVKRTIQRLGQGVPKRRPFNKNARSKSRDEPAGQSSNEDERRKLDRMIELAHLRLEEGDMDIYQKTYEDLEEAIN